MALALVTCGPAYEPIDGVRRITNESTGEIGTILSESLSAFGFEVLAFAAKCPASAQKTPGSFRFRRMVRS
jgi:phosphopantothenoylcysteine synthetase/decarboxylase